MDPERRRPRKKSSRQKRKERLNAREVELAICYVDPIFAKRNLDIVGWKYVFIGVSKAIYIFRSYKKAIMKIGTRKCKQEIDPTIMAGKVFPAKILVHERCIDDGCVLIRLSYLEPMNGPLLDEFSAITRTRKYNRIRDGQDRLGRKRRKRNG